LRALRPAATIAEMADPPKPRRRLPVVQAPRPEEEHARRPAWHWSVIVALGTLFGWLFLEMVAVPPLLRGLGAAEASAPATALHLAALAVPAAGVAALAGRLGEKARARHAIAGALGLVLLIAAVSWTRVGGGAIWAIASALAALTATVASLAGFVVGRRRPAPEA
jgi:hypothetical protein